MQTFNCLHCGKQHWTPTAMVLCAWNHTHPAPQPAEPRLPVWQPLMAPRRWEIEQRAN